MKSIRLRTSECVKRLKDSIIGNNIASTCAYFCEMQSGKLSEEKTAKRVRYDKAYLRLATEWAKLSHCKRKQVGAIIVKDNTIIADGYNGTPTGFENECEDDLGNTKWYVLHAEANAILKVARTTNNADGATLYLTHSPCKDCSKLILQSGIKRLVYNHAYKDRSGLDFLHQAGLEIDQIADLSAADPNPSS
jgi:dCMP deaminase